MLINTGGGGTTEMGNREKNKSAKVQNYESVKLRNNESAIKWKYENAKQRKAMQSNETEKHRYWETMKGRCETMKGRCETTKGQWKTTKLQNNNG